MEPIRNRANRKTIRITVTNKRSARLEPVGWQLSEENIALCSNYNGDCNHKRTSDELIS